jgi:Ca-activated chloride channel family protein
MRFAAPLWLLVLVMVIPLAALALARLDRRRQRDLAQFGDARVLARSSALGSRRARMAIRISALTALALLMLALARPQFGEQPASLRHEAHDILFVLDLSRSMNARDVAPSRLEDAKRAAAAIARALPNDRVGLVVFGGNAFLQLPLTLDHSVFSLFLDQASTEEIPDPATNLELAANITTAALNRSGGRGARVAVILSDGEDTEGKLMAAIEAFTHDHVQAYAVGLGTPQGGPIPERDSTGAEVDHRDWTGAVVITRLHEDNLRDIASQTGGTYVRWTGDASVQPIVQSISALATGEAASRVRAPLADRFQLPLALALAALVAEALLERPRGERRGRAGRATSATAASTPAARAGIAAAAVIGIIASLGAQSGSVHDAARFYREGHFRQALEAFRAMLHTPAVRRNQELSAMLSYNSGNALYRLTKYEEAVASYRASLTGPPQVRAHGYFNIGDAYMKIADGAADKRPALQAAINAYEEALVVDPSDADAKWNLELALRRMDTERQRLGFGPRRDPSGGGGTPTGTGYRGGAQVGAGAAPGGGFGSSEGGQSAPQITQAQARRMLEQIQMAQAAGQQGQFKGGAHPTSPRKDW